MTILIHLVWLLSRTYLAQNKCRKKGKREGKKGNRGEGREGKRERRQKRRKEGRRKERERKKTNDLINHLIWNALLVHLENSKLSFQRVLSIIPHVNSSLQVHTLCFSDIWYIYLSISISDIYIPDITSVIIVVVVLQLLNCVQLFVTPWTAARQASLSFPISLSLLKLMSIESVKPSNHLILCQPPLLLPSVFPNIRVFSNETDLHSRWKQYWSFSSSISVIITSLL